MDVLLQLISFVNFLSLMKIMSIKCTTDMVFFQRSQSTFSTKNVSVPVFDSILDTADVNKPKFEDHFLLTSTKPNQLPAYPNNYRRGATVLSTTSSARRSGSPPQSFVRSSTCPLAAFFSDNLINNPYWFHPFDLRPFFLKRPQQL